MSKEIKIFLGIGIFFVAAVIGLAWLVGQQNTAATIVDSKLLVKPDSHQNGSSGAKITIVEFGDYECPACGTAHPFVKQALNEYAGKINFVFRNYPLTQHKNALISAEAAEAAGAQGKFWEMHNKLYESQNDWANEMNPMGKFINYAKELSLDTNKFEEEINAKKYEAFIKADQADGDAIGIEATPTFFINNVKVVGIGSYQDLKRIIDGQLSK